MCFYSVLAADCWVLRNVLTFQTAVAFLADASCLAAPAPAFVAMGPTKAENEALHVQIKLATCYVL